MDVSVRGVFGSEENRIKRWFLFDGNRLLVSGVLLVSVFLSLLVLGVLWSVEYRRLLEDTTVVQTVFNTLLRGTILLVSLVVAITSVGISQELTSFDDQYERADSEIEFREKIEQLGGVDIRSAKAAEFLQAILKTVQQHTEALEEHTADTSDRELQTEVEKLAEAVSTEANEVYTTFKRVKPGSSDELIVGLNYGYSEQVHMALTIQTDFRDTLSESAHEELDRLVETLKNFSTTQEYYKTLYYKQEFSELSTVLLVTSLPVIVFNTYVLLALNTDLFPEVSILGLSPLSVFISAAYTVSLTPFIVLTAYILRVTTVTRRTLSAGLVEVAEDE